MKFQKASCVFLLGALLLFIALVSTVSAAAADDQGKKWVLLVAGSKDYYNYRHQSDIYHAYQLYVNLGIPEENIIVMHFDDIANNSQNPKPGTVINYPGGPNNYPGVPKDYTGKDVTPENFLKILSGENMGPGKKTIASGPNDRIFVFFSDHGSPGLIAFPGFSVLHAEDLVKTIEQMHNQNKYKEMVMYIEACESGSMFNNLLKDEWNVYAVTAANPFESSYACFSSNVYNTYLADCFSVDYLMETTKLMNNLDKVTFQDQYLSLKKQVNTSNVCQYGTKSISEEPLSLFFRGDKKQAEPQYSLGLMMPTPLVKIGGDALSSRKVKEHYLLNMIRKSNDYKYQMELKEHQRQYMRATVVFGALSHALNLHVVRAKDAASRASDHCYSRTMNPTCNKIAVQAMEKYCGQFNEANIEYASYIRDACTVASAEEVSARLRDICSITAL